MEVEKKTNVTEDNCHVFGDVTDHLGKWHKPYEGSHCALTTWFIYYCRYMFAMSCLLSACHICSCSITSKTLLLCGVFCESFCSIFVFFPCLFSTSVVFMQHFSSSAFVAVPFPSLHSLNILNQAAVWCKIICFLKHMWFFHCYWSAIEKR